MKTSVAGFILLVTLPATALAAPIVPIVGSTGAGWQAIGPAVNPQGVTPADAPNATRQQHYWAGYSYDRSNPASGSTACGAGALVLGYPCPWSLGGANGTLAPASPAQAGQITYYWGLPSEPGAPAPNFNADVSFYFDGLLDVDLRVLSEMTAWKEQVEIGWYEQGSPNATHVLIGGPGGIPKDVHGNYDLGGVTTVHLTGQYGFYYKNHATGAAFFTQSELNHIFAANGLTPYLAHFGLAVDDEFPIAMFDPRYYQQWALFGQGNQFWLGLEDILGPTTPCGPGVPCSDYDYNDFLIGGQVNPVPEPTSLAMLAIGLFGAALAVKRRSRSQ